MSDVKIRPAQSQDYDDLCCLFDEVDSLHRDSLPSIFQKPTDAVRDKDYLLGLMADKAVLLLVAEVNEKLVGLAHASIRESPPIPVLVPRRYAAIDSIIVTEAKRSHGIGHILAGRVVEWAKSQGATSVELNVFEFNKEAIKFYETLGYSTISRKMSIPV
jgi:diamine N-acetyltransferase